MSILWEIRSRAKRVVFHVTAAAVVGYFAYHAVEGSRGVKRWAELREDLSVAHTQQAALAAEREMLEGRVNLLRRWNLDPDLLEEQAKIILNYGREDEFLVILPPREKTHD